MYIIFIYLFQPFIRLVINSYKMVEIFMRIYNHSYNGYMNDYNVVLKKCFKTGLGRRLH